MKKRKKNNKERRPGFIAFFVHVNDISVISFYGEENEGAYGEGELLRCSVVFL